MKRRDAARARIVAPVVVAVVAASCAACARPHPALPTALPPLTRTPDSPFRAQAPPKPVATGPLIRLPSVQSFRLDNGMTVMVAERPDLPLASVLLANRAAHDDGTLDAAGAASLTAQMLVAATASSDHTATRDLQLDGAQPTIQVDDQGTTFEFTTTSDRVAQATRLLAGLVSPAAFDAAALKAARGAMNADLANRSFDVREQARAAARASLYARGQYLTQPIDRKQAVLCRFTEATARTFYERRYGPVHGALIVVGAVTARDVLALANEAFATWRAPKASAENPPLAPPKLLDDERDDDRLQIRGLTRRLGQTWLAIVTPCAGTSTQHDNVAFDLMATLLADGMRSRLKVALRYPTGDSYTVRAGCIERITSGDFTIDLDVRPSAAGQALERALSEIHRLQTTLAADSELEQAKALYLGHIATQVATDAGLAELLGYEYMHGRPDDDLGGFEARVRAISAAEIRDLAARTLSQSAMGVGVLGQSEILAPQLGHLGRVIWDHDD